MNRIPSPLAMFFLFVALLATALLAAAVFSPLVFFAIEIFPLHRIFNRIAMLVFLVGTYFLVRRMPFANRRTLGYGAPVAGFLKAAITGYSIGICLLGLTAALLFNLGVRRWAPQFAHPMALVFDLLPGAAFTGIAVGLIEETFFRGAMYGALRQRGTVTQAVFLSSILYAAVHFVGEKFRIPPAQVDLRSGFVLLAHFFRAYAQPLAIFDAFVALTLVGALLAIVRERLGHIGASLGLHAGFVTVIDCLRRASTPVFDNSWSFLIGTQDGLVGWLVAGMAAGALLVAIAWPRAKRSSIGLD